MRYDVAGITHVGKVRTVNQDRMLICTGMAGGTCTALLAVADGMGGLSCGERASALVVDALTRWWNTGAAEMEPERLSGSLDAVLYEAHREMYYLGEELKGRTGSTLSLLYLRGDAYLIKQIGDSRVYALKEGVVRQLTTDQTWCNRMIATGALTPEEASHHRLRHALVNALGVSPELEIATESGNARRGSSFLLCSDGFYSEAPLVRLTTDLRCVQAEFALETLLEEILAGPAADNATAVLCRLI